MHRGVWKPLTVMIPSWADTGIYHTGGSIGLASTSPTLLLPSPLLVQEVKDSQSPVGRGQAPRTLGPNSTGGERSEEEEHFSPNTALLRKRFLKVTRVFKYF